MKKITYIAIAALCAACTPPAVEESKLFLTEESAQELIAEGTILTLQKFKDTYMSEDGISVAVAAPEGGLTREDVAVIADIVIAQSSYSMADIHVIEV